MDRFFLNKQFFDFSIGKSYHLGSDFYLFVKDKKVIPDGYRKIYRYNLLFQVFDDPDLVDVFKAHVDLTSRKIQLCSPKYLLEADVWQAYNTYLPQSCCWFLPSSNIHVWLRHCLCSMFDYRNAGWI